MKFVPLEHTEEVICEIDPEQIFADVEAITPRIKDGTFWQKYVIGGVKYKVNLGNDRYQLFLRSRHCACCGLHGTKMFLARFEDLGERERRDDSPRIGYNFRLFAETHNTISNETHMVCMTVDHIQPRSQGGPDHMDNYQTLCYLCNQMKNVVGLSLEQINACIFTAYRIYRGTMTLRKIKELLAPHILKVEKARLAVLNIREGMDKVRDEKRREAMQQKIACEIQYAAELEQAVLDIERTAQVTGIIPEVLKLPERPRY